MRTHCSPSRARAALRLIAVVVLPTPPFWLAIARQMASDITDKATAKPAAMQTGQSEGVVEEAVESRDIGGCSTWNTRRPIELRVPRGTLGALSNVQNAFLSAQ